MIDACVSKTQLLIIKCKPEESIAWVLSDVISELLIPVHAHFRVRVRYSWPLQDKLNCPN